MVELFRYIEQEFVAPSSEDDTIDVAADSEFQNELKRKIDAGESQRQLREAAESFLDTVTGDGRAAFPREPKYRELRQQLLGLPGATVDKVTQAVQTVLGKPPVDLVSTAEFKSDKRLLSDAIVAIKLVTAFDRVDAAAITAMRQTVAFIEDVASGVTLDLSVASLHRRLTRPLSVPDLFLSRPPSEMPSRPDRPTPPDAPVSELVERRREQAIFHEAYDMLMGLHPSQFEIKTVAPTAGTIDAPPVPADGDRNVSDDAAVAPSVSVVALRSRALESLHPDVRRSIDTEIADSTSASVFDVMDVVKKRWLEVSKAVEPHNLPLPARTFRLGMHVFAIQEPTTALQVQPPPEPDFSHAVIRPVGIGNLQVVRQELIGYEAAEISHIENVLPGELMRRITRREVTTETQVVEETETTQMEERDVQSTQRNELAVEAQKEASQQTVSSEGQTTSTNYGRLVENSKTNYARSVTDRATNRLTQMVKVQRMQREKKVFLDDAMHELNNQEGSTRIRGIYQWVDRKYKARVLNYGKRLLYDVVVPEPAAFLIDSLKKAAQPENFQLVRPSPPPLPTSIGIYNYMELAALYGVSGAIAPPPEEFHVTIAHVDTRDLRKQIAEGGGNVHIAALKLTIPDNYRAVGGYIQRTSAVLTTAQHGRLFEFYIGKHNFRFGPGEINFLSHSFVLGGDAGELPVTLRSYAPVLHFNFAIAINCRRTDQAFEQWQLKTHAAITAGYQRQRAEYLDQLGRYQAAVRTQMSLAHNLGRDSTVERQELKRAFINLLMSEHFGQVSFPTPNPNQIPADPDYVKTWGAVAAFFERAFEWENLMYTFYPYFWGRPSRWGEMLLTQDIDQEFEAFLRAGAGRIVVPARPGFEGALAHYHETGDVWMGEEMPDMFGKNYVSIIAEIKARNLSAQDEVCVAEWDVRLPTTLVMLKDDDQLPAWQPSKKCQQLPSSSTALSAATATFATGSSDKDADTTVVVELMLGAAVVAKGASVGTKFDEDTISAPLAMPIAAPFTFGDVTAGHVRISVEIDGTDDWRFALQLSLTFADGAVKQFRWDNQRLNNSTTSRTLSLSSGLVT